MTNTDYQRGYEDGLDMARRAMVIYQEELTKLMGDLRLGTLTIGGVKGSIRIIEEIQKQTKAGG